MKPVQVLGICGSMRKGSATSEALRIALEGAHEAGARTQFIDIADANLPFCDGREDSDTYPKEVQDFRRALREAHGIIMGTPEYHNSLTGSLKNAIDLCTAEDFEHKMVGLIGVAGGSMGAINSINHMRTIMRGVGAWVVPHQVSISNSELVFMPDGHTEDVHIETRLRRLGADVAKFAALMVAGVIEIEGMEQV